MKVVIIEKNNIYEKDKRIHEANKTILADVNTNIYTIVYRGIWTYFYEYEVILLDTIEL